MSTTAINGQAGRMAAVPDKGFIFVGGAEAVSFLQSILTANIDLLANGQVMPGALLTPQGRILFDMMIYRRDDGIMLESDAPRIQDLFTRLRRYKLRCPITLEVLDHLQTWVFWDGAEMLADACADPRHETLGHRLIMPVEKTPLGDAAMADINLWHAARIAAGVPEGPTDLVPERALMLEAALDSLGAVDFTKGCYIGQEVTARTHYRGLVKRRLVPVRLKGDIPAIGSDITYQGRVIATSKSTATDATEESICWTLGLIKLSDIHAFLADPTGLTVGGCPAAIIVPNWMTPLPEPARTDS